MSCAHYRTLEPRQDQLDFKYPHSCYTTTCYASNFRNPNAEVCENKSYSGCHASWKIFNLNNLNKSDNEAHTNGRGDPPLTDTKVQMGKIVSVQMTREMTKHSGLRPVVSVEKMQIRLKMLEDSNAALNLRNRSLIAGNKNLTKRLEEDAIKMERLRENASLLQDELRSEKVKLADALAKQTKSDVCLEEKCTSTDIIPKIDRELQIWEACKNCDEEFENCQKGPLTVTITKSELELLEKDMRILRDAIIAREEAWDKAVERERNCQQHLARLTAEAITARHLCEARQDELRAITEALTEKESELKAVQKETLYLSKLIAKLHRYQKELETYASNCHINCNISEKEQKSIEEITRRIYPKGKWKTKSKYNSDKYMYPTLSSPRENKNAKD